MKTEYEYESECICKIECKGFVNVKCKLKKNKITALEYLIQEFSKGLDINFNRRTNHIIEQAKEMEKEQQGYSEKQMDDAYDKGIKDAIEKMYSEEEVLNILNEFCDNFYENSIRKDVIEKWLEQFKKK